jgi:hypothetical protein
MNAVAEVKRKNLTPAALEMRSIVKTIPIPMWQRNRKRTGVRGIFRVREAAFYTASSPRS